MYDMYPDSWGPAQHAHHREHTFETGRADAVGAVQRSFEPHSP